MAHTRHIDLWWSVAFYSLPFSLWSLSLSVNMSGPKKKKMGSEWMFNKEWTIKCLFQLGRINGCMLDISRNCYGFQYQQLATQIWSWLTTLASNQRKKGRLLFRGWRPIYRPKFFFTDKQRESSTKAIRLLAFKLGKANKPLSEGEFSWKVLRVVSGEQRQVWKNQFIAQACNWLCGTDWRRYSRRINRKADFFRLYSVAQDLSNDIRDTAQLQLFLSGIRDSFEITEGADIQPFTDPSYLTNTSDVSWELPWPTNSRLSCSSKKGRSTTLVPLKQNVSIILCYEINVFGKLFVQRLHFHALCFATC